MGGAAGDNVYERVNRYKEDGGDNPSYKTGV